MFHSVDAGHWLPAIHYTPGHFTHSDKEQEAYLHNLSQNVGCGWMEMSLLYILKKLDTVEQIAVVLLPHKSSAE